MAQKVVTIADKETLDEVHSDVTIIQDKLNGIVTNVNSLKNLIFSAKENAVSANNTFSSLNDDANSLSLQITQYMGILNDIQEILRSKG